MIDHFELFGLRQMFSAWRSDPAIDNGFRVAWLHRLVRHPSAYVLVALRFEERDLIADLGEPYRRYRQQVPMLVPRLRPPSRAEEFRSLARGGGPRRQGWCHAGTSAAGERR